MELIAVAVAFCAVFMPAFLVLEVSTSHPSAARLPMLPSAEEAAASYLAEHPLKAQPAAAANEAEERLAA
jgi:hypothetical protein